MTFSMLCDLMRLLIGFMLVKLAFQHCYELRMLGLRTSDTPDYRFEMTLNKNQTLSSVTHVLKPIAVPMWRILLVQHNIGKQAFGQVVSPKTLYNATYRVCEFWRYVKRIRVFNNVAHLVLQKDSSNMSLECPLAAGTYVFNNMHVPPDTTMLRFMYWPNTVHTLHGVVLAQQPDKTLVTKASYEINGTVIKSC